MSAVEQKLALHTVILEGFTDPKTGKWTDGTLQKLQHQSDRNRNIMAAAIFLIPILTEFLRFYVASATGIKH